MRLSKIMTAKIYDDEAQKKILCPKKYEDVEVKGLTSDSREVRKGFVFAAFQGAKQDGRGFIKQAIQYGASVILTDKETPLPEGVSAEDVVHIQDAKPRRRFAIMAANFYAAQPENIVGVTGTNGKTSVVHFTQQLWQLLGNKSMSLGTLGLRGAGYRSVGKMTSPDPVQLHASLADVASAGVTHLAMECSSHGLDQSRVDGVRMTAAAFTNLTQDHLDYHGTMEKYAAAKAKLFANVLIPGGTAVINADSDYASVMEEAAKKRGQRIISYGQKGYDVKLKQQQPHANGQNLVIEVFGKEYTIDLPLIGQFQAENVLCALGLVLSEYLDNRGEVPKIMKLLPFLKSPEGRMEYIEGHPKGASIYVDYAHTPDALEQVLKAIRPHTSKRIITVFGCGGDRDKAKRPLMGKIVADLSDLAIVTDDNPRGEDPAQIRQDIKTAIPDAQEMGRAEAIMQAIKIAQKDDVVLIAGKGHETGQIIKGQVLPFDDREEARKALLSL